MKTNYKKLFKILVVILFMIIGGFFISQKVNAGNGSHQCGSGDPNCWHGSCDFCGGSGSCFYCCTDNCGGGDPCDGNTNCGECGNPACCSPTYPNASSPQTPEDNSTGLNADAINFSYAAVGFGEGCPTRPAYYVQTSESCTAGYVNQYAGGSTNPTVGGFKWGTLYCWRVATTNGSYTNYSGVYRFTTNYPPIARNVTFLPSTTNTCNSGWSGNSGESTTDNPVTVSIDYYDQDNNFSSGVNELKRAHLGFIPQSQLTGIQNHTSVEPLLASTWGGKVEGLGGGSKQYAIANVTAINPWGINTSTGNISNSSGSASLIDINGNTLESTHIGSVQVDNQTIRSYWNVRFDDNYPSDMSNIYSMVIAGPQSGAFEISNDSLPGNTLRYADIGDWGVDVNLPDVFQPYADILTADTFEVLWNATDTASGIKDIDGFCWQSQGDSTTLTKIIPSPTQVTQLPVSDPDPNETANSNCFANYASSSGSNINRYRIAAASGDITSYNFRTRAEDTACNISTESVANDANAAWLLTYDGVSHTNDFDINISNTDITDIFKSSPGNIVGKSQGEAFGATYLMSLGQTLRPANGKDSSHSFILTNYSDANVNPPLEAGTSSYYEYLFNLVSSNVTVNQISSDEFSDITKTSDLPNAVGSGASHYSVNSALSLQKDLVCNTKSIIFVNGDLTIQPDFIAPIEVNGCIFVARGNIIIGSGDYVNQGNTVVGADTFYDRIDAFLITDGTFITQLDSPGSFVKWDGILINGSVVARFVTFDRDLRLLNNFSQPAEAILYDPRYVTIEEFRNALSVPGISIREKGFIESLKNN